MKFSLEGKVAVVTGASSGMGRAIAITYAEHGADVVVTGRNAERLEETAEAARRHGRRIVTVQADLLDPTQAAIPVDTAIEHLGGIDILVNNAGGAQMYVEGGVASLFDTTLKSVEDLFRLNTFSPFVTSQAAARRMRDQGRGGVIINVTSGAASHAAPDVHAYGGAKAAFHLMGLAWAKELSEYRIRVNEIAPGAVETTNLSRRLTTPEARARMAAPLGRLGVPDDIAAAALYLASDEAEWVSGAVLAVNGGPRR
jgi:NAD(P)-dependent dehydrogenase (short-subunit alcohol dehydrogenase family)